MRPANQQQAEQQMDYLLKSRIKGSCVKVIEHRKRARKIATELWLQYQIGPYQYQQKHIHWYLYSRMNTYSEARRYRYWLTIQLIIETLGRSVDWVVRSRLKG